MDKELTLKHVGWMWLIVVMVLGLILYVANRDYADDHQWIVDHSEIKR